MIVMTRRRGGRRRNATRLTQENTDDFEFHEVSAGHGNFPRHGDTVEVAYSGFLENPVKKFDSNPRFKFEIGKNQVVPCFETGLRKMKKGAHAILRCPSEMAYGPKGVPGKIPPNATLVFDVKRKN